MASNSSLPGPIVIGSVTLPEHLLADTAWAALGRTFLSYSIPIYEAFGGSGMFGGMLTFVLFSFVVFWSWCAGTRSGDLETQIRSLTEPICSLATFLPTISTVLLTSTTFWDSRWASNWRDSRLVAPLSKITLPPFPTFLNEQKYKMHPAKFEPQELNDKVTYGLKHGSWKGAIRNAFFYYVFFWWSDGIRFTTFPTSPYKMVLDMAMAYVLNVSVKEVEPRPAFLPSSI